MYGDLSNLEATPAESTSYRLAKHDRERYPDIKVSGTDDSPYYTNSSNLPVSYTDDVFSALDIQDRLQVLYTSGTVFHTFLGEKLPDWKAAMNLVRKISANYHLPYYTISPTYSVCQEHGYIKGEVYECPICHRPTEVYSRITGYYRPVKNWNIGKAQEFKERKVYNIENSVLTHTLQDTNEEIVQNREKIENKAEVSSAPKASYRYLLFTTAHCPKCKQIKQLLSTSGIKYEEIVVDPSQDNELVNKFNISKAPTLVILDNNEYQCFDDYQSISNVIHA